MDGLLDVMLGWLVLQRYASSLENINSFEDLIRVWIEINKQATSLEDPLDPERIFGILEPLLKSSLCGAVNNAIHWGR